MRILSRGYWEAASELGVHDYLHHVLLHRLKRWKCSTFGHNWSEPKREYEWAGYPIHTSSWHSCQFCEEWEETYSIYDMRWEHQKGGFNRDV